MEYQANDDPHFHGNLHVASAYQHKTLLEICALMERNLISMQDITAYQQWMCREDHFNLEEHNAHVETLEDRWNQNNSAPECIGLCQLPAYVANDGARSLWSGSHAFDLGEAAEDGAAFKKKYFADAQFIFSHCHHHWHPIDSKTKQRHPIRGCRTKKGNLCKARFPLLKRLTLVAKVICPGNARKHDLRVSGRRNAPGSILSRRRCPCFFFSE